MLEKAPHLVAQHLLFRLGGDSTLKQHEDGVTKGVALLGQIAQVVASQDSLLFSLEGVRCLPFEKRLSTHHGFSAEI